MPKRLRPIMASPVSAFAWSRRVAERLGFDEREAKRMQVGELVAHATLYHACTGKVRYLVELLNRAEGKVPDRIEADGSKRPTLVIQLAPTEPPPDWYANVRQLIGHQSGDPPLPGETRCREPPKPVPKKSDRVG
jgi:hypothetical protein